MAVLFASSLAIAPPCAAQSAPPASADRVGEAETHFRRGVALYKDADFAGAIVEFKRAYEIAPNYRVLYNLGQAYYQAQRYAEALQAFDAYLTQGGSEIPAARRAQVENDRKQLEARVGKIEIAVNVDGADVRVDDETVGTSPLKDAALVSVGHSKITVAKAGRVPLERFVDVAAGDRLKLTFDFPLPSAPVPAPAPVVATHPLPASPPASAPPTASTSSGGFPWVPWAVTGVLAAGTATTGVLTLSAKSDLTTQLGAFPGDPTAIDHAHSRARTMATVTDVLLGATVISAGVALWITLARDGGRAPVSVGLGPGSVSLRGEL